VTPSSTGRPSSAGGMDSWSGSRRPGAGGGKCFFGLGNRLYSIRWRGPT